MLRNLSIPDIRSVLAAIVLAVTALASVTAFAQQRAVTTASAVDPGAAEVNSLCNPQKVSSSSRGKQTVYACEGKKPTPRPAGTARLKSPGGGGLRAEINCTYESSGGAMTWLGCTCTANDSGNCTNFITWCAEQGDEVGGNSGGASCKPAG